MLKFWSRMSHKGPCVKGLVLSLYYWNKGEVFKRLSLMRGLSTFGCCPWRELWDTNLFLPFIFRHDENGLFYGLNLKCPPLPKAHVLKVWSCWEMMETLRGRENRSLGVCHWRAYGTLAHSSLTFCSPNAMLWTTLLHHILPFKISWPNSMGLSDHDWNLWNTKSK
jgi:hypothetical protein